MARGKRDKKREWMAQSARFADLAVRARARALPPARDASRATVRAHRSRSALTSVMSALMSSARAPRGVAAPSAPSRGRARSDRVPSAIRVETKTRTRTKATTTTAAAGKTERKSTACGATTKNAAAAAIASAVTTALVAMPALAEDAAAASEVRSVHWSPYDRVRVVNADP
jgi:hypothetical protein